jgi:hypothetical protein
MRQATAATACLVLALAGCADNSDQDASYSVGEVIDMHAELWTATEEQIAECMREQGFSYVPRPFPEDTMSIRAGVSDDLSDGVFDLRLPSVDEAERDGFGIVDGVLADAEQPAGEPADPNLEIREQLSDLEQAAWSAALEGDAASGTAGCRAEADELARAEAGELVAVEGQIAAFGEAIDSDPRYQRLQEDLSDCLAERGVDPPDLDELRARLSQEAGALLQTAASEGRPVSARAAAELREREIVLATEAAQCSEPLQPTLDEIVRDAREAAG